VTPEVTPEADPELRLLRVVQGEVSRQSLQRTLGLTDAEHFRQHYLAPALAAGLLERMRVA
jgi:ATP-dependent DNA helicase RecG